MAEIALPSFDFARVTVELEQNYQVNRSAWTGRRRVTALPGIERWLANCQTDPIATEVEERAWRAFLVGARGPVNRFRLQVACSQTDVGSTTVQTSGSPSNTLALTGLPAFTQILEAGQYMTVPLTSGHHRLVMLTADLISNGSGQASATFLPRLGGAVTAGTLVEIVNPYLMASLISSKQGWTTENGLTQFTVDAEEAL